MSKNKNTLNERNYNDIAENIKTMNEKYNGNRTVEPRKANARNKTSKAAQKKEVPKEEKDLFKLNGQSFYSIIREVDEFVMMFLNVLKIESKYNFNLIVDDKKMYFFMSDSSSIYCMYVIDANFIHDFYCKEPLYLTISSQQFNTKISELKKNNNKSSVTITIDEEKNNLVFGILNSDASTKSDYISVTSMEKNDKDKLALLNYYIGIVGNREGKSNFIFDTSSLLFDKNINHYIIKEDISSTDNKIIIDVCNDNSGSNKCSSLNLKNKCPTSFDKKEIKVRLKDRNSIPKAYSGKKAKHSEECFVFNDENLAISNIYLTKSTGISINQNYFVIFPLEGAKSLDSEKKDIIDIVKKDDGRNNAVKKKREQAVL